MKTPRTTRDTTNTANLFLLHLRLRRQMKNAWRSSARWTLSADGTLGSVCNSSKRRTMRRNGPGRLIYPTMRRLVKPS